ARAGAGIGAGDGQRRWNFFHRAEPSKGRRQLRERRRGTDFPAPWRRISVGPASKIGGSSRRRLRELDVLRSGHAHVEVVGGRTKLAQRELLALGAARVDAVFRHVDNIVADVKADDRVVNAVVRADAGDYHVVS